MTTKMVFHGSDIEKICDYYHLNKEDIVKFGANVNPLGLSTSVKKELQKMSIFFLPIRTEIMYLSEIRSQNTAGFPLNLFCPETVPAN